MVGGGNNAFIGAVHRAAALMDNRIELVCGCFSSHPDISLASGREYFLPDNRIYFSHAEMIEKESALPDGERMDFISIVTPNVTHFEPAMMALDKGFDVVIEKPMTFTLEQAKQLKQKVLQTGRTVMAKRDGREPEASWLDFPGVDDGIRGMQFIETVVKSGYEQNVKWIKWIE